MIFKKIFEIGLNDISKGNFITNKAIIKNLENIGANHSDQVGYGVLDIPNTNASWVVLDWKIEIIKRPIYGQKLNIHTWARTTKRAYTYRDYIIYDEQGNKMVIATSRWALISLDNGRPVKLDNSIIDRFEPEEDKKVFGFEELEKLKEPSSFQNIIYYKVNRSDIDINKHMHNLYYLDLAYEVLPQDVYETITFDKIRITYKKEIKLGDVVKSKYTYEGDKHIITICDENESIIHSIIELEEFR